MTVLRPLTRGEVEEARASFNKACQDPSAPRGLGPLSADLVRRLFDTLDAHEAGMDGSFKPLPKEQAMIEEFKAFHDGLHGEDPTAIGGRYTLTFNPTSIGLGVTARCVVCKGHRNCTDYDSW